MAGDDAPYRPKDAIKLSMQAALAMGGAGFFAAAVRNALTRENVGAWSVFTRSGGMIATFTLGGIGFQFTETAVANLRQKDDPWNATAGGFVAGAILGMQQRKLPIVIGVGAFIASTMGLIGFTGNRLRGWKDRPEEDEFDLKMKWRANRRRSIEETIAEIGEGRGIQPPGYEERRRLRLKEKYGVEINPVRATVED